MRIRILLFLLVCSAVAAADERPTAEQLTFFETKIRPVLAESCYECHSEKAVQIGKLDSDLLLDSRAGIRRGGDSGPAVVPNDPESSLLISAIQHDSFEMPPTTKLPQNVIDDFVRWVEMGAPDPREGKAVTLAKKDIDVAAGKEFWSFRPLQQTTPPTVARTDWPQTDVDRYILSKLEDQGIAPNDAADRTTLIRRLYFDAWGLPPEREDVAAFVADESPEAYEKLVDRLLASPHYGERWARHWLDVARFAESNGYAFDQLRPTAFHYRDFVIKAFNEDMPYDEFVRLQVAGDLVDRDSYLAQAATGFLAAGPFTTQQTMKERERSRYEQLDDIVGTLGTSMLGLTIGCARCHDHKFDPVGHQDYYRLTANFAEIGFQDYNWDPDPAGTKKLLDAFNAEHQPFADVRAAYERDTLPGRLADWESHPDHEPVERKLSPWQYLGPLKVANHRAGLKKEFGPEHNVDLTKTIDDVAWTAKPEWSDGSVHMTLNGDRTVHYLYRTIDVPEAVVIDASIGNDDGAKAFLNGIQVLNDARVGAAAADENIIALPLKAGRNEFVLKVANGGGGGGFYFEARDMSIPQEIDSILQLATDDRNEAQQKLLLKWYGLRDPEWLQLNSAELVHLTKKPQPDLTPIFAARKGGVTYNFGDDTRKVYFLARGNSNSKTGQATPAYLRVLMNSDAHESAWLTDDTSSAPAAASATSAASNGKHPRIALGDWLTDDQEGAGHLLARVIVNRLWQHHMGRGIVGTPSDFGTQGLPPTHPALLDYLATQLIEGGWRLKPIHKLIMMSAVYRLNGDISDAGTQHDVDNHLWWRRSPQRMDAEIIRDSLLAVSGSLDSKMFGPGSLEPGDMRRSVYLTIKRGELIPLLQLFDAPDGMQGIGDRGVTTVPPQALAMMNSPEIRELAEKVAKRVRQDGAESPDQIVENAYRTVLSRAPEPAETEQMKAFIAGQADRYGNNESALTTAIEDYCQLMLCLNEFVYVD